MYLRLPIRLLAFAATLLPAAVSAQVPPPPPPPPPVAIPSTGAPMLATDRYLFVMRDNALYQFDLKTLRLLHSFDFAATANAAKVARPAAGPTDDAVAVQIHDPQQQPPAAAAPGIAAAVDAALGWLAAHQDENGRWDADGFMKHDDEGERCDGPGNAVHDVGVTGLAMLALLGDGNTLRSGKYKDNLKRAAGWLREQQQQNGLIGVNASHDFIYDHAIAAFALCEAYGLSKYTILKDAAQKSLNYLESHRNPYSVWRYQPRDNDNDTSVTTWALFALSSGKFFSLETNPNAFKVVQTWYDQVTDQTGKAGYTKMGEPSSRHPGDHGTRFPVDRGEAMTASALSGRFLLGQDPKEIPVMKAAANLMLSKPPDWQPDRIDAYYWYMGTMAMYQMGGRYWTEWSRRLAAIVEVQRHDGNFAGSWDPIGVWDEDGGRVYATALYALSLQSVERAAKLVK